MLMVWNYTNYINHKVGNLLKVQLPVQLFFADAKEMWKPCFTLVLPAGCRTFPYGIRFDKDLQVTFVRPLFRVSHSRYCVMKTTTADLPGNKQVNINISQHFSHKLHI